MHGLSHASLALALAPALALVLARGAAAVRHSVLHIIVDDLRPELGAYGLPGARQNACRQDTAPSPFYATTRTLQPAICSCAALAQCKKPPLAPGHR